MPRIYLRESANNVVEIYYDEIIPGGNDVIIVKDNDKPNPIVVPVANIAYFELPKDYKNKHN